MRKFLAVFFCCLFLLLTLSGCGGQISFTWLVDAVPANLDPQLTTQGSDLVAIYNLYSGLVRLDANGEPQPECAESWDISADNLTYTFHLKPGLAYEKLKHHEKEYPLTAHDFVFAFQRVFQKDTKSPYTAEFSAIQNSQQVLSGALTPEMLGVHAPNDSTVVFQLEHSDPQFLKKLSLPGAMPCNQEFFESTRGAYGLSAHGSISANILANGPFHLYNWNENGLFLRRDAQGSRITSLRIVLNATGSEPVSSGTEAIPPLTGAALLSADKASAALSDDFKSTSFQAFPYTATTWALTFNCNNSLLSQPQLRQALAAAALNTALDIPEGSQPAQGLIPPALSANGQPYREAAGNLLPHFEDPASLCRQGLAAAGASRLSDISIIFPEGMDIRPLAEELNQQWQKQLNPFSAFFPIKELPMEEFAKRLKSGDYQIALVPFSPVKDSPAEILHQVSISNPTNPTAQLIEPLNRTAHLELDELMDLERQILADATVVPLWYQSKSLLVQPNIKGLVFRPFGPVLDLTWAEASK